MVCVRQAWPVTACQLCVHMTKSMAFMMTLSVQHFVLGMPPFRHLRI